jgi:thiol:disulfide interchange protein/DsbC/DsbD-like thiol-disulfide interchange protein
MRGRGAGRPPLTAGGRAEIDGSPGGAVGPGAAARAVSGGPRWRIWRVLVVLVVAPFLLAAGPRATGAATGRAVPRVAVELVGEFREIVPGQSFWLGLRERIAPGWHTYWINPGDSGEPATIEWALPLGFAAGAIVWPRPERIPVGPFVSYGYADEVVLLTRVTAPPNLEPGARMTLRGHAAWLVCNRICIPEEALLALTVSVSASQPSTDTRGAALIARARRAVPGASPWPAWFSATSDTVAIRVAAAGLAPDRVAGVWFYPAQWGVIDHAAPQAVSITRDAITVRVPRGALEAATAGPIDGVLVITERLDGGPASQAFSLRALPEALGGSSGPGARSGLTLFRAVALALVGGLVLNLMPCVLPVLSVKALWLVGHAGAGRATLRRHGGAYAGGVLASFAIVAGVLIAIRAGGEQLGWGFQFQSPLVVSLLADVLLLLALSLSGVVLIGGRLVGAGGELAARSGYAGAFFSGALATVAATPCTAPFMGAAVGFALAQPWGTALVVFEALGLGFALPYVVLAFVPAWRRLLPRPGPWMEWFRQLLAFPLYASVAWLVWVVSEQAGPEGVAGALAGLVLIGLAAWLYGATRGARARGRRAATAAAVILVAAAVGTDLVAGAGSSAPTPVAAPGQRGVSSSPFSPSRLAELRAEGVPVFVNVTAAWCITCLVNERIALRSPAVAAAFARKGVVYLRADWTHRDSRIARVLESFGRSGVPLYLLYPPAAAGRPAAGEPTVLPQILSEETIVEAVERM